jgi:hypothetical protein
MCVKYAVIPFVAALCCCASAARLGQPAVSVLRVPDGGIQPQVVEQDGVVHLIYFSGDSQKGNIYYVKSRDYGHTFSRPVPVNHTRGSAIAVGNIRGAQIAVGRNGRVYVAWNGSSAAEPRGPAGETPMLYTRLNDAGTAFEPERNVIRKAYGLDGGGSLAADANGNVYVFWHAPLVGQKGEANRRVWMAKSSDDGRTFAPEVMAFPDATGACGCCGMRAYADAADNIYVLFRSATNVVNRDIWLLTSTDRGHSFHGADISRWKIGACVMSSASLASSPSGVLAAWETEKQTWFARIKPGTSSMSAPTPAPGSAINRKYPVVVSNSRGETLFAWTEGTAWKRGGAVEWQVYDPQDHVESTSGKADGVPAFSLIAAFAKPDGSFVVLY